ncbi:MAG: hypothetical protein WC516_06310 [Patescibacteria group bacterium]|jgi:hypothetical protein
MKKLSIVKAVLVRMIIMCEERINVLTEEMENTEVQWDEYAIKEIEEQIAHFKSLKEDAEGAINLLVNS